MKKFNKILMAVLTLCLAFALTGCSDKKAEKKYYDDVMAAVNNASTANSTLITDLQTFLSDVTNEDARTATLKDLDTMEAEFTTLRDLKVPKIYKDAQVVFKEGAEAAIDGIAVYRKAIEGCTEETITDQETFNTFEAAIGEGDEYMTTSNTKISEAAQIADDAQK